MILSHSGSAAALSRSPWVTCLLIPWTPLPTWQCSGEPPHSVHTSQVVQWSVWCALCSYKNGSKTRELFRDRHTDNSWEASCTELKYPVLRNTVEPLIMDTPKSGQPPYNGQTVRPLHIYCPYISTSEEGTTSEQWAKCSSPTCPLFRGSTVLCVLSNYYVMLCHPGVQWPSGEDRSRECW